MEEMHDRNFIHEINGLYEEFGSYDSDVIKYCLRKPAHRMKRSGPFCRVGIYFPTLGQGGVQRVISLLIPLYLKNGYDVVLITEEEKQKTDYEIPGGVKRYVIEKMKMVEKTHSYILRAMQLEEIFFKERIDILCYHCAWSPLLYYDFLLADHYNVYFILCKHQIFSYELVRHDDQYFRQKVLFRLFDAMVVLSEYEETYWRKLGVNACYIPNPYDTRSSYRKKRNAGSIVWVGRLEQYQKRFLDIIPIMRSVVDRLPDCRLKIFGSGNLSVIKYLKEAIADNGLQDNIMYCGYTENMDEIYSDARLQLSTASYEAFPMNIYEGKSYGIPLVIYKLPYVELLKDQKGYVSVEQGDTTAAAESIIRILTDGELEKRLRKEALDSVKDFSGQEIVRKWNVLFCDLGKDNTLGISEDFEMILDTIYGNYELSRQEVCKNYYIIWKEYLLATVRYHALKKSAKIVIYPYGKVGRAIKKILNENEIYEEYIVDNLRCIEDGSIISLEQMKEKTISEFLFLVCSTSKGEFFDIRKALYDVVPKENVLDLFPKDKVFHNEFTLLEGVF